MSKDFITKTNSKILVQNNTNITIESNQRQNDSKANGIIQTLTYHSLSYKYRVYKKNLKKNKKALIKIKTRELKLQYAEEIKKK